MVRTGQATVTIQRKFLLKKRNNMSSKKPQWVKDKEALQKHQEEPPVFIGKMGADGVINGLLPNGEVYHRNLRKKR